jgi:hypothetical protein
MPKERPRNGLIVQEVEGGACSFVAKACLRLT